MRPLACLLLVACNEAALVPPTVEDDPSLPAWSGNGTTFHLERRGEPSLPAMVLLHGGPGDDYRYLLTLADQEGLTSSCELILFDQRGSGLSARVDEGVDLATYLQDLEILVDEIVGDRPLVLVGHSWGGTYATMYADAHPDRVSGLVLLEPGELSTALGEQIEGSSLALDPTAEWLNDWMYGRQLLAMSDHERADFFLAQGLLSEVQPQRNDEPSRAWRLGAAVKVSLYLGELAEPFDFTAHLGELVPEVLLVAGSETEDLGPDFQRLQAEAFSHATLEVVEGAGHSDLTGGRARETAGLIADYLRRVGVTP